MKKKYLKHVVTIAFLAGSICVSGQSIKSYQLKNGLTVILDANPRDTQISGKVVVNVGSAEEEPQATGVAHYLEHMLFKGTTELGTVDWEKEKIHYNKIIELYDALQEAKTEEEIAAINKKINEESQKQAQYIVTNELSAAVQQMGGVGLNAYTSRDRTVYYNTFPSNQLEKWLALYSHRFKKPVFRLFQTELETVYEEKNRSSDNLFMPYYYKTQELLYGKQDPYARPIIGKTEHLKKPWMRGMIAFYKKWYVPNNMALILSGNFDMKKAVRLIEVYFGSLEARELPPKPYGEVSFPTEEVEEKIKQTPYLMASKNYLIPNKIIGKEKVALLVIADILSNTAQTGLLDKMYIDGDVMSIGASFAEFKRNGLFTIEYIPRFDINQRRQESFKYIEKWIEKELDKVRKGTYEDWLLQSVKVGMTQNWEETMSTPSGRSAVYVHLFNLGQSIRFIGTYVELLRSMDKPYLAHVAQKYLQKNAIVIRSEKGNVASSKALKKPELDPIKSINTRHSDYFEEWVEKEEGTADFSFFNMEDIQESTFQDKVKLYYLKNDRNNLFRLVIKFYVGTKKHPLLPYAVRLLNKAGILGQYESDALRKEFGKRNVRYSFTSGEDATYVVLEGYEAQLGAACQLLSRLMLFPEIKEKALDGIIGQELNSRSVEKKSIAAGRSALQNYLLYGERSPYIHRISNDSIISLAPSVLSAVFHDATTHEAAVHYYGNMPEEKVTKILKNNLAFGEKRKDREPLREKKKKEYSENTIFLVNDPKATQAHIYLLLHSDAIPLQDIPKVKAFNQYFSGSFNGLVTKEIRENRALAYTSHAVVDTPVLRSWNSYMTGYVGTQTDKVVEAVTVLLDLLQNMPEYPNRMQGIIDYFKNSSEMEREDKSVYSLLVEHWKLMGYDTNPKVQELPLLEKLTFDDVKETFVRLIKGRKYAIGIFGKMKEIDVEKLKKLGKVKKIKRSKLFSKET